MSEDIAPLIVLPIVGCLILGALYSALLIGAHQLWRRVGLWGAAVSCCGTLWWVLRREPSFGDMPFVEQAFVYGLVLSCTTIPAFVVERASERDPVPSVWRRVAYGVGGVYIAFAATLVVGVAVWVGSALLAR